MSSFWNSNIGKLFIGGCGTQMGVLFVLGGLGATLLFCVVCATPTVLSLGLAQAPQPPPVSIADSSSPEEATLLRQGVVSLVEQIIDLRTNGLAVQPLTAASSPPPSKPIVIANQGAVNLRSGPSITYNRIGRLPLGGSLEIVGRAQDSNWWLVEAPGGLAWISGDVTAAANVDDSIPVVTIPALLVQPASLSPAVVAPTASSSTGGPAITSGPTPVPIPGTPTAVAGQSRRFAQDTVGYKQLVRRLLLPTVSESFSPHGDRLAITEKIKLYTIEVDGSSSRILLEDDDTINLLGDVVWSPDGEYIAFVADRLDDCSLCRVVGLVAMGDGSINYLDPPAGAAIDRPRWTQDGRLLVTVYWTEPAEGAAYIYDTSGQGQLAAGSYILSSSHAGQKWFPWQPGKVWQVDHPEGTGSYFSD
jgi:hypothetical protein